MLADATRPTTLRIYIYPLPCARHHRSFERHGESLGS